ncbi:DUF3800 domain-containing protein [Caballeronia concitans]|uniref:DUF3800 domain-containing protein n=1 Tax=Caballeronia concitans TaxID=1777133 RepID=A0A658R3M2_9BURK|nr:DUF3800 domain-containing protein [Caballeronia concitans]KIG10377.1 Protein of unknown function DUF3800 [Burkholderia sp. MR1]SAL45202.1 hypothetical protein AWB72_04751 [Caballeronia concitans]
MHLLYLDESGSAADPHQRYFVLAGVCAFERTTHWIEQKLNAIAARFEPVNSHLLELHGSPMRSGRDGWKRFPLQDRLQAIKDALHDCIAAQSQINVRLFGAVITKASLEKQEAVELAFEQLANRFDLFLLRRYRKHGDAQRGLILFDKSSTEQRVQTLAREFKYIGHTYGKTRNYAEVPVFLDSRSSRLIQLADLVAFALFRSHEYDDHQFYDIIKHRFDSEGGVKHGLYLYPAVEAANASEAVAEFAA